MPGEVRAHEKPVRVALWSELADRVPAGALVAGVDLVVIRHDDTVTVLYGRCHHRGALLADGHIDGDNLICGVELMKVLARACGHDHLSGFCPRDLTTWKREVAALTGVSYAGVS